MAKKNQKLKLRKLVEEVEPFEPLVKSAQSGSADPQGEAVPSESNPQDVEKAVEVSSEGVEASTEKSDPTPDQVPVEISSEGVEASTEKSELTPDQVPVEVSSEGVEASTEKSELTSDQVPADTLPQDVPASAEDEFAEEDLLADVRQSLIEEESLEKEKPQKWWRKVGKGRKKDKVTKPVSEEEINLPVTDIPIGAIAEQEKAKESEEYLEQIDELINMLEPTTEAETLVSSVEEEAPAPPETVHPIDIDELKKQAFRPRPAGEEAENISDVRAIALEGDEEVFVEVESKVEDPWEERLKALENAFKPYRRYINVAFAVLGAVIAVIAGLLLYNAYQQFKPAEPTPVVSNLPFPTTVSLPGGWSFNLGQGPLDQDGRWNPQGAEWLQGTEVCRWVALPWSRQLEAVIRTLNPDDPIELVMSNNDRFVYNVYSVRQLTSDEMLDLDSSSPCLLLVLAEADSDSRWVLTALP